MKFLIVFVHCEDVPDAAEALRKQDFHFTMLHSTSGFLQEESRTFLMGISEERIDACLEIFRKHCKSRIVGAPGSFLAGQTVKEDDFGEKYRPATVEVGGAVGFSLEAERLL